jgi:uncharacterized membrane protein
MLISIVSNVYTMLETIHERFDHPTVVWFLIIGVTMSVVGMTVDMLGRPTIAGYIGMLSAMMLLFAVITFVPLFVLKKTSPMFMEYDSGSIKKT